jgi:hypothetical protein
MKIGNKTQAPPNINQFTTICEGCELSPNVTLALALKKSLANI